jgi:hypothetical protein
MLYQALKPYSIILETTETRDLDAGLGLVLIPEPNSKVFLHWPLGDKLRASYTMTEATRVYERVRLINASNRIIEIKILDLG